MATINNNNNSKTEKKKVNKRKMGNNELFVNFCHDHGNLNVMCGLTLVTRQAVDEGLMKCALQEFQHMYPQLTSRVRRDEQQSLYFIPMECPTFPLDTEFKCKDMLHEKFDTENGPLWRVQLITETTMDKAGLDFGPELAAIVSDDADVSTRWRYFLRYFQGNVNGKEVERFDEEVEGFRSFILITFHPSITDTLGSFHLMRQFLYILDSSLEEEGMKPPPLTSEEIHQSVGSLLPPGENSIHFSDTVPMFKVLGSFVMPRKNLFEEFGQSHINLKGRTEMIRGRLDDEETAELNAMMEEDDASMHGVMLAASLIAVSRVLQSHTSHEYPPSKTLHIRATNEANLRQYCASAPKHGCLTTYFEENYNVPPISDKTEFWRFAHEMTVKNNSAKGSREPLKLLRVYSKMFTLGGENSFKDMDKQCKLQNEVGVAVYGDLGSLFRREMIPSSALESLNVTQRNIRLEDVFHMVSGQNMGSPMTVTSHILYGKLNYILMFHTTYIDASVAFKVRDEVSDILRMATEKL